MEFQDLLSLKNEKESYFKMSSAANVIGALRVIHTTLDELIHLKNRAL